MLPPAYVILGSVIAWMTIISNVNCDNDKCKKDLMGSKVFALPKKLERIHIKANIDKITLPVPTMCLVTQAVEATACAPDVAPYVDVQNFHTVNVHRNGALGNEIYVDIIVYCNRWGFIQQSRIPIMTALGTVPQ